MKRLLSLCLVLLLASPAQAAYMPSHPVLIHHQENTASCWAHASVALAETLAARVNGEAHAFSVEHLITHTTTGGGSPALFWEYALSRQGLLNADLTPSGLRVLSHAEKNNAGLAAVKSLIERFGAVTAQIAYPPDTGATLYNPAPAPLNHQVLLIGYDDAYPAAAFSPAAPGNGAFLAQNSYGEDANSGGLFWISYHDAGVLTQIEAATSLVSDPDAYTPKREWTTYALSAADFRTTVPLTVPEGEELRAVTIPQIAAGTEVTLTVGGQTVSWLQALAGSHTVYLTPQTGSLLIRVQMTNANHTLYYPADPAREGALSADGLTLTYGELALLYAFAPEAAAPEQILLAPATPAEVSLGGKSYPGYQMLGRSLIRLRDWADANGHGVLWDGETRTVTLTDTPAPQPAAPPNPAAVATISKSRLSGDFPDSDLYFIDGYQYFIL